MDKQVEWMWQQISTSSWWANVLKRGHVEGLWFTKTTLTEVVGCEDGTGSGVVSSTEERKTIVIRATKQLTFGTVGLCVFCWLSPLAGTGHFQNCFGEDIKSRFNSENACYQSVQIFVSSRVLSRNIIIIIIIRLALQSSVDHCIPRTSPRIVSILGMDP
jgi:hypothetical protein